MKNKFDDVYNTVVHWRKSLFLLPSGSTGKRLIEEMTRLINSWTFRSEQDTIASSVKWGHLCHFDLEPNFPTNPIGSSGPLWVRLYFP